MINIKNILLGIAIFILTMFVGIYGISTLYEKAPQYDDYCPPIINQSQCVSAEGTWVDNSGIVVDAGRPVKPIEAGYCQYDYTKCQKEFDSANEKYHKKVFIVAIPLGVIIIVLGALVFGLETVGAGLMAGGVGIIIYGVGGYWQYTKDWMKFSISLVGLIIVIWLAYYANKRWHKKEHEEMR